MHHQHVVVNDVRGAADGIVTVVVGGDVVVVVGGGGGGGDVVVVVVVVVNQRVRVRYPAARGEYVLV